MYDFSLLVGALRNRNGFARGSFFSRKESTASLLEVQWIFSATMRPDTALGLYRMAVGLVGMTRASPIADRCVLVFDESDRHGLIFDGLCWVAVNSAMKCWNSGISRKV